MNRRLPLTLVVCLGVLLGLGAATFRYAEGFSYFSNDPRACANCHVMRPYLDSWQKSSHHARAACNDCHTPHAIVPKMVTKAENGWNHSVKFTLQTYPEALRITPHNAGHPPQEAARILGEAIDYARQGEIEALRVAQTRARR